MTKREQILELLERHFKGSHNPHLYFDDCTDAILALPIDVPTDEDIEAWADSKERRLTSYHKGLQDGAKAMRDGEIKGINKN